MSKKISFQGSKAFNEVRLEIEHEAIFGDEILTKEEQMELAAVKSIADGFCQWTLGLNGMFIPAAKTVKQVDPGIYAIEENPQLGYYLKKLDVITNDLIRFDDSICDEIVADIKKFWTLKEKYATIKQRYSRGILVHGSAGAGKTSINNLVVQDVISFGGIAIRFQNPYTFTKMMHSFRKIEPNRPVVILMEDIEAIIEEFGESEILNILDGINSVDNIVYLATTNYPDKLLGRVTNRPSRFDRVFELKAPNTAVRKFYLESLVNKHKDKVDEEINIDKWVGDTSSLSIAHLKELFISVALFGYNYKKTLETLRGMKKNLKASEDAEAKRVGFGGEE